MILLKRIIPLFSALLLIFSSCDQLNLDPGQSQLSFSKDTLTFDTVFTSMGSATSKILIYNNSSSEILLKSVRLAAGSQSFFRINLDGAVSSDQSFSDVWLMAKDSMYIFVEVHIDPNDLESPVVAEDSILFETKNGVQAVHLEAFGKNMILFSNKTIYNDTVLNSDKPYLIYGDLVVDSGRTLQMDPGCELYFHQNANLVIYGNLRANGTFEKPVVMQGDRFDKIKFTDPVPYQDVSGQWGGVYLLNPGGKHLLNHVNMQSGYVGVYMLNRDWLNKPNLRMTYCRVHNFTFYGVVAVNADLQVFNSEISNSGSYSVYLNGGKHTFVHATVANYFNSGASQPIARKLSASVMIMDLNKAVPMDVKFINSIISGSQTRELTLASKYPGEMKVEFKNCYIRRDSAINHTGFYQNRWYDIADTVFVSTSAGYKDPKYFDFQLDSVSPAKDLADPAYSKLYPIDLNGKQRLNDGKPDAGAFEWYPSTAQ